MRNLIVFKEEPGMRSTIRRAEQAAAALAPSGLPIRLAVDPRHIAIRSGVRIKIAGLYNYLPGQTIAWEAYTMQHIKLLGSVMAQMHRQWESLAPPPDGAKDIEAVLLVQLDRMQNYFTESGVQAAARAKLRLRLDQLHFERYTKLLDAMRRIDKRHYLHMDFVRGNVLFEGKGEQLHISGILDFEKVAIGHPLYDIARTLAFLIIDCKYKSYAQVRKYFLYSGYQKRGQQHLPRVRFRSGQLVLEELVNLFLLHDLYKFMRHNPYEALAANDHYLRTRDELIKRNILKEFVD